MFNTSNGSLIGSWWTEEDTHVYQQTLHQQTFFRMDEFMNGYFFDITRFLIILVETCTGVTPVYFEIITLILGFPVLCFLYMSLSPFLCMQYHPCWLISIFFLSEW